MNAARNIARKYDAQRPAIEVASARRAGMTRAEALAAVSQVVSEAEERLAA